MKRISIHNPANLEGGIIAAVFPDALEIDQGEEIQLVDMNDQDLTYAEVVNAWSGPLIHIPASILEMANDPLQRTFSGVFMHLAARREKAETVIDDETIVTALILRPKASTLIRPTMNQIKSVRS